MNKDIAELQDRTADLLARILYLENSHGETKQPIIYEPPDTEWSKKQWDAVTQGRAERLYNSKRIDKLEEYLHFKKEKGQPQGKAKTKGYTEYDFTI